MHSAHKSGGIRAHACLFFLFPVQFDVTTFDAVECLNSIAYELFCLLQRYFLVARFYADVLWVVLSVVRGQGDHIC
jgi:hypothetical protein